MKGRRRFPRKLLALLAALMLVPSGAALASQRYDDSAGDAPPGAPDMTSLSISHTFGGHVTFNVAFANRSALSGDDLFWIAIDADRNNATGFGSSGVEWSIAVDGDYLNFLALIYDLRNPSPTIVPGVPVSWSRNVISFTVDKGQIGSPTTAFDFQAVTTGAMSSTNPVFETVPHSGELTYSLATEIAAIQIPKAVTTIKTGRVFSIRGATVKLTTGEVFAPETLAAGARVAGKALKPLPGGLAWKVPKTATGKKLVVTMTVSYQGMEKTQTLTLRVVK